MVEKCTDLAGNPCDTGIPPAATLPRDGCAHGIPPMRSFERLSFREFENRLARVKEKMMLEQLGSQASLFKRVFPFFNRIFSVFGVVFLCFFLWFVVLCHGRLHEQHSSCTWQFLFLPVWPLLCHTQSFNFAVTLVFWSFPLLHQHHRTWSRTLLFFVVVFIRLHWHNAIWVGYGNARTLGGLTLSLAPKRRRGSMRQPVGAQEPDAFSRSPDRRRGSPRILVPLPARYGPG